MLLAMAGAAVAAGNTFEGRVGPAYGITPSGRLLHPAGRLTALGDFPTGGALSPDGRFYWAVDSGHGRDDVRVVDVATGAVRQVLPLPGAYGGIAYAPDGRWVYVSGEPVGNSHPVGATRGNDGDVIHVLAVDPRTGRAAERSPIALPPTSGGSAQRLGGNPASIAIQTPGPGPSSGLGWPIGLAVTRDQRFLAVALNQADQLAIVDLPTRAIRLVKVGAYPYGVAVDGHTAYVSNEYDGTVSVVDIDAAAVRSSITVGSRNSHPEGLVFDHGRLFVAVTNQDLVAVVDTGRAMVTTTISLARPAGVGTAPVAVAIAPDRKRLYVADAGEDAIAVVALARGADTRPRVVGRVPTAFYPTAVAVTPDGRSLIWVAAKGLGAGPNPTYGEHYAASEEAPYGTYVPDMLIGRLGVLATPSNRAAVRMAHVVDSEIRPANLIPVAANSPIHAPGGGPSRQVQHVFYVVRENRTYDQIFGTDARGDGDPKIELFDDNGAPGLAGGVTPNAHRLARMFPLLDHVYANSEVSVDGHIITSGAYATDFVLKALHANYANRGRIANFGQDPVTFPPNAFVFDQAVRQGVSFRNFGEISAGVLPSGNDGRITYESVVANTAWGYPLFFGCQGIPGLEPNGVNNAVVCDTDSGLGVPADATRSRIDFFSADFARQVASGTVPALTYITLPNDHTNGVHPNYPTPRAMVADNDLALGQLVDVISHSAIWSSSAIIVIEDDSQDGADHVDAHRMPAFVISPWARHGAVVHTRYDQLSALRTAELIVGLKPLSLGDALAEPMYDAFIPGDAKPDLTPYSAVRPTQPLDALNPIGAQGLDRALPYTQLDLVPQRLLDAAIWRSVYGSSARPPRPGPDASPAEARRAEQVLRVWRAHGDVAAWLRSHPYGNDD